MFLTVAELHELTGYTYSSRQVIWLQQHKWKFELTGQKRPKVARSYFESRLGASFSKQEIEMYPSQQRPNFLAIINKNR